MLLTDVVMPRMGGMELAVQLCTERPGTRVLLMSGYTQNGLLHQEDLAQHTAFIAKPFNPDDLCLKVREVLDV